MTYDYRAGRVPSEEVLDPVLLIEPVIELTGSMADSVSREHAQCYVRPRPRARGVTVRLEALTPRLGGWPKHASSRNGVRLARGPAVPALLSHPPSHTDIRAHWSWRSDV